MRRSGKGFMGRQGKVKKSADEIPVLIDDSLAEKVRKKMKFRRRVHGLHGNKLPCRSSASPTREDSAVPPPGGPEGPGAAGPWTINGTFPEALGGNRGILRVFGPA